MKKLLALIALPLIAHAELPEELVMPTDVGKVAITVKECQVQNRHGFTYKAYATEFKEGNVVTHEGCWNKKGDIVYIWFYNEEPPVVASYKDFHFKPATNI